MLQIQPDRRAAFIKWLLNQKGIRFHGADLQKSTGASKSNISQMLSSQIPVSENFFRTFIEHYRVTQSDVEKFTSLVPNEGTISAQEHIAELKRHNAFLEKIIDSSLLNMGANLNLLVDKLINDGPVQDQQKGSIVAAQSDQVANTTKDSGVTVVRDNVKKKDSSGKAGKKIS